MSKGNKTAAVPKKLEALPNDMPQPIYGPAVSVLGERKDDGEWEATALEMDLRGSGKTFEAALEKLHGCVIAQIEFAQSENNPDRLCFSRAPIVYWKKFMIAQKGAFFSPPKEGARRIYAVLPIRMPRHLAEKTSRRAHG